MSSDSIAKRDTVPYVLRHLANVWDNSCGLAEPIAMDATNANGIVTIRVPDLDAVEQWNRVLEGPGTPHTNHYPDRAPMHGVHIWDWHGWTIHIWAYEDEPDTVTDNQQPTDAELERLAEGLGRL
jgi:hypothetical protein